MFRVTISFPALLFLAGVFLLSGCGEPEAPRFVPASGNEPVADSARRPVGEKASREITIPKNIETH